MTEAQAICLAAVGVFEDRNTRRWHMKHLTSQRQCSLSLALPGSTKPVPRVPR
jgi:hypothetical protein